MKESQVLIVGLTNCCTELARHLVLSGINIKLVALKKEGANSEVGAQDYEDEFLVSPEDVGKSKGTVIVSKLQEMNPFSTIAFAELENTDEALRAFMAEVKPAAVVFGLSATPFSEAIRINNLAREIEAPFYCLNASGLSAFIFSDLAVASFEFQHTKKDAEGVETHSLGKVEGSISLQDFSNKLLSTDHPISWKKRELLKPGKLNLLGVAQQLMSESGKPQDLLSFIKSKPGLSAHAALYESSEKFKAQLSAFNVCFTNNLEFNPASGVIGAITSQEIIKVITRKDFP